MDDYAFLHKYARTGDIRTWKPATSPITIDRARATIDAIRNRQEISIPMLQSILSLPANPEALELLNNGSLIQDCILYLYQKQKEDTRYPFGCEQGYLYFSIIALAIGFSLISRFNIPLDAIVNKIHEERGLKDPTVTVMQLVAGVVSEQINAPFSAPDDFLGWSSRNRAPIISKPNTLLLLDILWKDRKRFLRAWAETQAPSLNGLVFIFWRCVLIASTPDRWVFFCDFFWRYSLAARSEDLGSLQKINNDTMLHQHTWLSKKRAADLEDSRNLLCVLTTRLSSTSPLYSCPNITSITGMIMVAVPISGFQTGVEDLFMPLLRAIFDHFWIYMAEEGLDREYGLQPGEVGVLVTPTYVMLDHLIEFSPGRVKEFVQRIAELGIIDALARSFALVKKESQVDEELFVAPLVRPCNTFLDYLIRVGTTGYRQAVFDDSFVEWFKAFRYMRARDGISDTRTHHMPWYNSASQCWMRVGDVLGYNKQVRNAETLTRGCAYTRCPDPNTVKGVRFECPCDKGMVYCGMRCQQADWMMDSLPTSHRHTCTWGQ